LCNPINPIINYHQPDKIDDELQDDMIETLTYYNYGENLEMMIFNEYIHIIYKEQDFWLARYENGQIQSIKSILSIYGAN
jgi:hypothetical protein